MILNTGSIKFYNGFIHHSRKDGKEHFFKNKMNAIFIELRNDKCKETYKYPTLFSINKFNLLAWYSSNHGDQLNHSENQNLYQFILDLIQKSGANENKVRNIRLLTFPKVLGWGFNPLSIYFCYDAKGSLLHLSLIHI